jgi:transketolase
MIKFSKEKFLKKVKKIKIDAIKSIYHAKSGHPGGVLSAADIVTYLFFNEIKINKKNINSLNRNRFILSKGHAAPLLYSIGAELGLIKKVDLLKLRNIDSNLQGHTSRNHTPWVEANTGSLGQGFSFGIGQALACKLNKSNNKVYVMIGDGEIQEGMIWEGALFASNYSLNNLCVILDNNKIQNDNFVKNIIKINPIGKKWKSFNWNVITINGHNFKQIKEAINKFKKEKNKPTLILANTIKGKGVNFMENNPLWHGSIDIGQENYEKAIKELSNE